MARYLDLRVDKVFKAVFAQKAHKSSLIDLLNDLLPELEVRDLSYIRGEMQGYCFDSKSSRFDLCCKLADGTEVTVEMQMARQDFFKDRAVYYASLPVLEEINAGEVYRLTPRYLVSFLNFRLDHEDEEQWGGRVLSSYALRERDTGEKFSEAMNLVFVELPRFRKSLGELETDKDRWYYLLKNMTRIKEIPTEFNEMKFRRFFEAVDYESLPKEAKIEYDKVMTTERDIKNQIAYARKEGQITGIEKGRAAGLAEGLAEGLARGQIAGRAEGESEAKLLIARNMKAEGVDTMTIASWTGLTEAQVEEL